MKTLTTSYPSEHVEQRDLVSWFRKAYPDYPIFSIPNGGHRNKIVAMKLKAEGVSAGVPDLYCPGLELWIEMKRRKDGRLSREQKDWIEYLEGIGHTAIVGLGCDDAKAKIIAFMGR